MTNSGADRLDRIEQLIEQNSQQIARTQSQVALNSQAIQVLIQTSQQALQVQTTERQQLDQTLASINASLERIDRIMDYLLRQQGGNQQ